MKNLIITADDFGLNTAVTEGIGVALSEGVVTCASVMANMPGSLLAGTLARTHDFDVGWHLNLTEGRPLSPVQHVHSLVDTEGRFHPLRTFIRRCYDRNICSAHVEHEIDRQYAWIVDNGIIPSHLDGHQHVHILPTVSTVVRRRLPQWRIPFLRLPREQGLGIPRLAARLFLLAQPGSWQHFWHTTGVRSLPFGGVSLVGTAQHLALWERVLRRIRHPCTELMVHPGYSDTTAHDVGQYPGDRAAELACLRSPEWKALIDVMGFRLVGFRDLLKHA